ncbi:hypothetical protein ACUVJI_23185 (plasmid) [Vibrio parahaemolyticus]|uniref:hypothetical protein n=1 Tax=Vibrio parahaemolyticus TaxID=670 RepID=UPI004054E302
MSANFKSLTEWKVCENLEIKELDTDRKALTKRLRVIRNAWHFCFAVTSVFKAQCRNFGIALLTP